jgi:hypothetical protein
MTSRADHGSINVPTDSAFLSSEVNRGASMLREDRSAMSKWLFFGTPMVMTGLAVSVTGTGLGIQVATGEGIDGSGYPVYVPSSVPNTAVAFGNPAEGTAPTATLATADGSHDRIDLIYLRAATLLTDFAEILTFDGNTTSSQVLPQTRMSYFTLGVVQGTPGASPAVPAALLATDLLLAQVRVTAGETTLISGNVTDVRTQIGGVPRINAANTFSAINSFSAGIAATTGNFTAATDATSTATGALQVAGGFGLAKALWVGGLANVAGVLTAANTTDASSSTAAGTIVSGGLAVAKKLNVGTSAIIGGALQIGGAFTGATTGTFSDTTDATSTSTGSLQTAGGFGLAKALWVGGLANIAGVLTAANSTDATSSTAGGTVVSGGLAVAKKLNVGTSAIVGGALQIGGALTGATTGAFSDATDATSSTAASVTLAGGLAVAKKLNVGTSGIFGGALQIGGALSGVSTLAASGVLTLTAITDSTSTSTGSIIASGGFGLAKALWVGGLANIAGVLTVANTTDASNSTTAGTVVSGGLAVAKTIYLGGNLLFDGSSTRQLGIAAPGSGSGNYLQFYAGSSAAGTDLNGGDLYLQSGGSTGAGYSTMHFRVPTPGSSGTASHGASDVGTWTYAQLTVSTPISATYPITITDAAGGGHAAYMKIKRGTATDYAESVYSTSTADNWYTGLTSGDSNYHIYDAVNSANALTIAPSSLLATFYGPLTSASKISAGNTGSTTTPPWFWANDYSTSAGHAQFMGNWNLAGVNAWGLGYADTSSSTPNVMLGQCSPTTGAWSSGGVNLSLQGGSLTAGTITGASYVYFSRADGHAAMIFNNGGSYWLQEFVDSSSNWHLARSSTLTDTPGTDMLTVTPSGALTAASITANTNAGILTQSTYDGSNLNGFSGSTYGLKITSNSSNGFIRTSYYSPGGGNYALATRWNAPSTGLMSDINGAPFSFWQGTDANPYFAIRGDGYLTWGPGGSTTLDTFLYRSGANALTTTAALSVGALTATGSHTLYGTTAGHPGQTIISDGGAYYPYLRQYAWTGGSSSYYGVGLGVGNDGAGHPVLMLTAGTANTTVGSETQAVVALFRGSDSSTTFGTTVGTGANPVYMGALTATGATLSGSLVLPAPSSSGTVDSNTIANYEAGHFTGTLTGCTTSPTATIYYVKFAHGVILTLPGGLAATSNSTACTITGLPASLQPSRTVSTIATILDNGVNQAGNVSVAPGSSAITLLTRDNPFSFTASGLKGCQPFSFCYVLN